MYVPSSFRETDPRFLADFLDRHGFATLISTDGSRPIATHLLLQARVREGYPILLRGHMSRENPQWKTFDPAKEVLAVFQGPHAYVSAAWYSVQSAPTWNYISVHAYGLPRIIEERGELREMLKGLVDAQEKRYPSDRRYSIESLPADFLNGMMNGVVGFQIEVTRVESAAKMSQNRSPQDYQNIIDMLKAQGDPESAGVAAEMERRKRPPSS